MERERGDTRREHTVRRSSTNCVAEVVAPRCVAYRAARRTTPAVSRPASNPRCYCSTHSTDGRHSRSFFFFIIHFESPLPWDTEKRKAQRNWIINFTRRFQGPYVSILPFCTCIAIRFPIIIITVITVYIVIIVIAPPWLYHWYNIYYPPPPLIFFLTYFFTFLKYLKFLKKIPYLLRKITSFLLLWEKIQVLDIAKFELIRGRGGGGEVLTVSRITFFLLGIPDYYGKITRSRYSSFKMQNVKKHFCDHDIHKFNEDIFTLYFAVFFREKLHGY